MRKAFLQSCLIFAFIAVCVAKVIPLHPNAETVRGTWVGFSPDANDFYRLELRDPDGFAASSFAGGNVKLYKIDSWSLSTSGGMVINTSPISTNAYPILVTGKAKSSQIQLTVKGPEGGWVHEIILNKEELVEKRMQILKSSMDQINKK